MLLEEGEIMLKENMMQQKYEVNESIYLRDVAKTIGFCLLTSLNGRAWKFLKITVYSRTEYFKIELYLYLCKVMEYLQKRKLGLCGIREPIMVNQLKTLDDTRVSRYTSLSFKKKICSLLLLKKHVTNYFLKI